MKILFILAIGVLAFLFFTSACEFQVTSVSDSAQSSKRSVTKVSELLARAARKENYRAAKAQAAALRELAGRANTELMRLGLTQCVLRASGMPL